jgi:hypothetical protein
LRIVSIDKIETTSLKSRIIIDVDVSKTVAVGSYMLSSDRGKYFHRKNLSRELLLKRLKGSLKFDVITEGEGVSK